MKATVFPPASGGNNVRILLCSSSLLLVILIAFFALTTHATSVGRIIPQQGSKEADLISKLPGQPTVAFSQYSGYVTVDTESGRAYFYYLAESSNATIKSSGPLVLWLSGGPGCSSMAAAMMELGPFRVQSDGKTLYENTFAWNKVANVLFLESPIGVGYSYTNTSSDFGALNDDFVAKDNFNFLLNWLERYPEYKGRDLFLAGNDYAGHFLPQLADLILQKNVKIIKLQGISLGNPRLDYETNAKEQFEYLWNRDLISDKDIETIRKTCDFTAPAGKPVNGCPSAWNLKTTDVIFRKMDRHNIYGASCRNATITDTPKEDNKVLFDVDTCIGAYVAHYLNTPEVQSSLHANVTKLSYPWVQCSNSSNYRSNEGLNMLPVLEKLLNNRIRILIYSGDLDAVVPFSGTKKLIKQLNVHNSTHFNNWSDSTATDAQLAGFFTEYQEGLTNVLVRAAGHHVPMWQPERALIVIGHFLNHTSPPRARIVAYEDVSQEEIDKYLDGVPNAYDGSAAAPPS